MNITRNLIVALLMTVVTTVLLGVVYPLVITGLAQVIFPDKANGQLIEQNGKSSARGLSVRRSRLRAISIRGRLRLAPGMTRPIRPAPTSGRRTRS